jgi:hypothetical protein
MQLPEGQISVPISGYYSLINVMTCVVFVSQVIMLNAMHLACALRSTACFSAVV